MSLTRWARLLAALGALWLGLASAADKLLEIDPVAPLLLQRIGDSETPACFAVATVAEKTKFSFGCSADAGPQKLTRDKLFEIGSITKGLTGLLLADMVRAGEVRLDDPVSKYARPGAKLPTRGGREITLRDLVTHTSGLPPMPPGLAPRDPRNPYADLDLDAFYEALARTELLHDIGLRHSYSNFGYMWLSQLLAAAAGKPFDQLLAERVLRPLGMTSATIGFTPAQQKRRVVGHGLLYEPVPHWERPERDLAGAGGVSASIADMARLAEALAGVRNTPLDATIQLALEKLQPLAAPGDYIGYGWMADQQAKVPVYWHNGGTGGFSAMIAVDRAGHKAAVVLADSVARFDDLARHLVDPAYPLLRKTPTLALSTTERGEYEGRYELSPQFSMQVFVRDGRLLAQGTKQQPFEIRAVAKDLFIVIGVNARLRFERGADGKVARLVIYQNGRQESGTRVP